METICISIVLELNTANTIHTALTSQEWEHDQSTKNSNKNKRAAAAGREKLSGKYFRFQWDVEQLKIYIITKKKKWICMHKKVMRHDFK